jgi:hypothetical protein
MMESPGSESLRSRRKDMDEARAQALLATLANGVNPLTGEVFPADSPYQAPDVVRALYTAGRALEGRARPRRAGTPAKAGTPWTEEEDRRLIAEFDAGVTLAELAQSHGRTPAGIQARLEKHERTAQPPAARQSFRFSAGRGSGPRS